MRADHYARSGRRWALGAELVYGPIAAELVAMSPHSLAGRTVLDAGAGAGAASSALTAQHSRVLAMDLSAGMLAWDAATRPPCAVADIRALPLADGSVDDTIAALRAQPPHEPVPGLTELARITRPGGAVLAAVFSNDSRSQARDRIDAMALAAFAAKSQASRPTRRPSSSWACGPAAHAPVNGCPTSCRAFAVSTGHVRAGARVV
jgi:SAM-dependent methyltransferase